MKIFIAICLVLLTVFGAILLPFVLQLTVLHNEVLKPYQSLELIEKQEIYKKITPVLRDILKETDPEEQNEFTVILNQSIDATVTESYIKKKFDQFQNEFWDYMTFNTNNLPVLTMPEFKENILQTIEKSDYTQAQKSDLKSQIDDTYQLNLTVGDLLNATDSDLRLIRDNYQSYRQFVIVAGLVLLVVLATHVWLSYKHGAWRGWLAALLLSSGILSMNIWLLQAILNSQLNQLTASDLNDDKNEVALVQIIVDFLGNSSLSVSIQVTIWACLLIVGAIIILLWGRWPRREKQTNRESVPNSV